MKKQIIYEKTGRLRFVGHLDFMRTIHRAMRRAEIPLAYSQGFNPHPQMSFASPLTLGSAGTGEIMEIKTEKDISDEALMTALSKELPEGIRIVGVSTLADSEPPIMAKVTAASYVIELPDALESWEQALQTFLGTEQILLKKMGKVHGRKREIEVDVKPWIYSWKMIDGHTMELLCACGSVQNLKPDLLIHELFSSLGLSNLNYSEKITRTAFYGQENGQFVNYSRTEKETDRL